MRKRNYSHKIIFFLLAFFFCHFLNAQKRVDDFANNWKKIDALINKGLTKSALDAVNTIYITAKKDKNDPQIIKALLYKITLTQNVEEDASAKNIETFEKEITLANEPAKSILQSIAAEIFWNYFQQNRYKLYQRTNTINFNKTDIATWTSGDLHKKITELYLLSLKDEKLLQQTKPEPFDAIIIRGTVRYLRPTLYDLLAHRALDYFKNDENDIQRPAFAFEIKNKEAFVPANDFIKYTFTTKDSLSLHHKALIILQKLLAFHIDDGKPDALIDADIERLNFIKQYGVMENKDSLYIDALQNIEAKYSNSSSSAQASFLIAQTIYDKALQRSDNENSASFYTVIQAKEKLDDIIKKFPQSEGGINASNLLSQILHKDLSLTSEKVNIPNEPFRTLVRYKNFSTIYLRIIDMTPQFKKFIESNDNDEQLWKKLAAQKFKKSWKQDLVLTTDYLSHSVEIKTDGLPAGQYALLASVAEDFNLNKNPLAVQYFHVSNISYINNELQYFILDRKTGQPLGGAKVQVWKQKYDYGTQKNILEKNELLTTDKNGYIKITGNKKDENSSSRLEIFYQNDHLFLDDYQYNYSYNNEDKDEYSDQKNYDEEKAKIFLFTDRSIYRPGQLVYFKGIGVTQDYKTKKNKLLQSKDSIKIFLEDANSQKIDSIKLLLNDYGSINGKFRLPENKLNGEFSIEINNYENSSIDFSIEEYKRPKFYTAFEKVKGSYRVGDTVSIAGSAKAYAGNNIDGASVKYRVTRVARFLYPWLFWRKGFPRTSALEITNGETITDVDGTFTIKFAAIPDLSIDKNTDPVFDYKIEADVTDINGETRSSDITVPAGYKMLDLQITVPSTDAISVDSLKNIFVSTKNLSGEFEPSKVDVKIYKLQPQQRLMRSRYWAQPDKFVMSKEEFLQFFPNDEYSDETKKETWSKNELVFSVNDSTSPNSKFKIQNLKFTQGWYVAEAISKDKYGQEVKDVKYFQLYDIKAASLPAPVYAWNATVNNVVEPGEKAQFISGTSANNLFIIQQINKPQTRQKNIDPGFEFINLNNEKKKFEFKATEEDRGGFGVSQVFVKDNRVYLNGFNVLVPWTNKDLNISFDTYRDKTLPGSEEKWKVKISGHKGEKVAAEMLASMYDASLDQFKEHSWTALDIWPINSNYEKWNGSQNFLSVQAIEKYWNEKYIEQKEKRYDVFNYLEGQFYPTIKRKDLTGAISTFRFSEPKVVMDLELTGQSLSGKTSGVSIITINGTPDLGVVSALIKNKVSPIDQSQIQIRKNFNETAFFFPELRTDKDGNIEFNFTMPEALTQWKLRTLAHTKDLASGYATKTIVTQKDLMVQPNAPRFVREGDRLEFSAKIVNMNTKDIIGNAELHLLNASTMNSVDSRFKNIVSSQSFTVKAGQSALVNFSIEIPVNFNNAVVYRIVAKAGDISDGEEAAIPVVTNRMLVTETMPLPMKGDSSKSFRFEKLLKPSSSSTLTSYGLTIEYTTNPAWYAVQALPYLMEYPYECAEQTFSRYYANALATKIVSSSPKLKEIFEKWKITDTAALMSNLQKNDELKSVLLEETPWVLQAQNEDQQKKNIALLFDAVRTSLQLESNLEKLTDMQSPDGGFVWFKDGPDNRYMTQYILTGIGHLKRLHALPAFQQNSLKLIIDKAVVYLDKMMKKDYDNLIKYKSNLNINNLSEVSIQYLYMRSFFPEYIITKETKTAFNYYREQEKKYWLSQSKYMQAMIALALTRSGDNTTAGNIIQSLKENAINNDELGMYWKEWENYGYWWYQAPIESQSMMIEAFSEIEKNSASVNDMKTWLLKNKQTNSWSTTKATADACYALLLQGTDWLSEEKNVSIQLGNTVINNTNEKQEASTGYFKEKIDGDKVKPDMGNISVTVSSPINQLSPGQANSTPSWGSVYWQYFENLDKISFSETPLRLVKKLFIEKNTENGPVLMPVNDGDKIHIGDKIKVRIELRVDRDMEYVHMKDMRASCMEPINVISEYKYQDGLGYYETTKDVSTNFFFDYLNKGTYVFEYPMFVTHNGNFSNGITTIQCMYAPEFTAHSEGVRVNVSN